MEVFFFWLISTLMPLIFLILQLLSPLVGYILTGIGLMKAGKIEKVKCSWLSWIPIGNRFITGKITDRIENENGKKRSYGLILLIISLSAIAIFFLVTYLMFGGIVNIIIRIVNVIIDIFNAGGFNFTSLTGFIRPIYEIIKQLIIGTLTFEQLFGMVLPNIWMLFPSCILLFVIHVTIKVLIYIASYKMLKKYDYKNRKIYFILSLICHALFGLRFVLPACLLRSVSKFKKREKEIEIKE